ncbi:class I SAM-dependent rRNA methyltransferase [Aneurinibacillus tyrosinisolvens]|uniref:class I SAM-dependent rRNA methyltransferase n=1 Tax=Aneurinibacillus tyrosinisolvens TaxID=1443435 RepID=UPI00063F9529|nr:class I SAM-dependent rRNA methyltransferase [Aneurinibacillus tyrosinisolvens]
MAKVFLVRNRRKRIEQGHPWVYQSEVDKVEGEYTPGDMVEVVNHQGHFLAKGYINPESQMMVRIMTFKSDEEVDQAMYTRRIREAWTFRRRFLPDIRSCRVVYGEADFLPGLVVEKFEDVLVVQILSLGMEVRKDWVFNALLEVFAPKAIYLRNDVYVRELEGLEQEKGFWYGESETEIEIEENGLKLIVDIENGQKTGYFFDQRENRSAIAPLMKGWGESHGIRMLPVEENGQTETKPVDKRGKVVKNPFWDGAEVLDCFTHTGSFTLNACKHGAKKVTTLDISEHAIETARRSVQLNGFLHRVDFVVANAFDYLREAAKEEKLWDVVILDPPAFAKSRGAVKGAQRGYKDINLNGLKLVRDGGYLVTASCSYHMSPELFKETIQEAAIDAKKILRLIHWSGAGVDHPKIATVDEGDYLKFAIYEVRSRV